MSGDHIFHATGDSCAICMALDGNFVSAGYRAHENCNCQTTPYYDDETCGYESDVAEYDIINFLAFPGSHDSFESLDATDIEVTVTCPNGDEKSGTLISGGWSGNEFESRVFDEVFVFAMELCDECPQIESPYVC